MDITDEERDQFDLLASACEDIVPLWEARWELGDIERGRNAIRSLCARGWVSLYYAKAWIGREERELSAEEAEVILADLEDEKYWAPQDEKGENGFYCFTATEAGEEAYINDEKVTTYMQDEWMKRKQAIRNLFNY